MVSASLDQTVIVWDCTALHRAFSLAPNDRQDQAGGVLAVKKYVLQGHTGGVNWARFDSRLPLVLSVSEDRSIILWRMNESRVSDCLPFFYFFNSFLPSVALCILGLAS